MQQIVGFTMQNWGDGACGKYSIPHALLILGIPVSLKEVNKATGIPAMVTRAVGTGPNRIIRALDSFRQLYHQLLFGSFTGSDMIISRVECSQFRILVTQVPA